MHEEIKKKSGKALAWSGVTEIMAKLVTPIVNIILARLLTPEAFGAVATITMVITFAEIFTDAGFQKYIVQHEFESEDELNKSTNVAFWTNFTVSALLTVLIVAFRHQIASLVGSDGLGNAIAVASLAIIMVAFSSIQMARFKRDLDFKSLFFVRIGSSTIPLVVTVPLAFALRNFWALVIGTLCVNLFNAVTLTVKSRWKPKLYYSFSRFKAMFSFTVWTMAESVLVWVTANIDIFVVGNILGNHYLGLYKTSMATVNSYMSIITSAVMPVLFSTLSRYQDSDEQYHITYYNFLKYTSLLILPMSIGVLVFKDLVTTILLGKQWLEASGFLGIWALMSGVIILSSGFASEVYRSKGNPKLATVCQCIHLALLIPAVVISSRFGFEVLYKVRTLVRLEGVIIPTILLCFIYKFKLTSIVKSIFPSFVAAVIMGTVGYLCLTVNGELWWQIVAVFICIAVYFIVLFVLFPKTRKEIFELPVVRKCLGRLKKIRRG